jgi:hypothetical protein
MIQTEDLNGKAHKLIRNINFLVSISVANFYPFLIDLIHSKHTTKVSAITLTGLHPLILLITSYVLVTQRFFGMRKKLVVIALLLQCISYFVFAYVHNQRDNSDVHKDSPLLPIMFIARLIQSVGHSIQLTTFYSYMAIIPGTTKSTDKRFGYLEASTILAYVVCPFIRDLLDYLEYEKWTMIYFAVWNLACSVIFHYQFPVLIENKTDRSLAPENPIEMLLKSKQIKGSFFLLSMMYAGIGILIALVPNSLNDNIGLLLAGFPYMTLLLTLLISVIKKNDRRNYFTIGSILIITSFSLIGPESETEGNSNRVMFFFAGLGLLAFSIPFFSVPCLQEFIDEVQEISAIKYSDIQPISDSAVFLVTGSYSLGILTGFLFERLYMDSKDKYYYTGLRDYIIVFAIAFLFYFFLAGGKDALCNCCSAKSGKVYTEPQGEDDSTDRSVEIQEISHDETSAWQDSHNQKSSEDVY